MGLIEQQLKKQEINNLKQQIISETRAAVQNEIDNANANVSVLTKIVRGMLSQMKGDKGDSIRGEKGDTGTQGVKGDRGIQGLQGDAGKDGKDGKNGKDGTNGSPDTYTEIIDKINSAPLKPQYQIRAEHIIGLPDSFAKKQGYHGGGDINMSYVLDSFLDGVTKSFTIPANRRVNYVICSSAPNIITVNDFTLSGTRNTTITFSVNIDASISLAQGQTVVIDYII